MDIGVLLTGERCRVRASRSGRSSELVARPPRRVMRGLVQGLRRRDGLDQRVLGPKRIPTYIRGTRWAAWQGLTVPHAQV